MKIFVTLVKSLLSAAVSVIIVVVAVAVPLGVDLGNLTISNPSAYEGFAGARNKADGNLSLNHPF